MPTHVESILKIPLGWLKNIIAKGINTNSNSISTLENLLFSLYTSDLLKCTEERKREENPNSFVALFHILLLFKNDLSKTAHFNCLTVKNEKLLATS